MKKLAIAMLLMSTPAMADVVSGVSKPGEVQGTYIPPAQTGGVAPQANTVGQPCYPIGKTDKGDLVYSMDCQNVPVTLPGGALSGSGQSGFSDGPLQNSNPTGFSNVTPPNITSGSTPDGYSNVTPKK